MHYTSYYANQNIEKRHIFEVKAIRPQAFLGCALYWRFDGVCVYLNLVFMLRLHVAFTWAAVQFNISKFNL